MDRAATTQADPALLAGYRGSDGYDELVGRDGAVRSHWGPLAAALEALGRPELERRHHQLRRLLQGDGVTYRAFGPGRAGNEWALDPIPLVMASHEWLGLEEAVTERAELLNLVLADLYGPRDLVRRGLVPPEVVHGHPGFLRPCDGLPASLFSYAVDLARRPDGGVQVLADFAQAPSGAGYALENRTVMSRVFPSLYRDAGVHRLAPFFRALRAGLTAAAPPGTDDPRVVVLTPGPFNEAYFEHAHLATVLGYPLVQGTDLAVRGDRVWLRSLGGLERVDVILRRVDGWWSDPLELKPDSRLGIPGLLGACRAGTVSVVNPVGTSVLENPALLPFLPGVARHLLGHELRLEAAPTWWCGDDASRSHVQANLEHLVVKPIARRAGRTSVFGPELAAARRDELRRAIEARPWAWVGQELVDTATAPTLGRDSVEPRHAVLRLFAVARGASYAVMPGGLTRVAPERGDRLVSNQAGAVSKDTWVISSEPEPRDAFWLRPGPGVEALVPARSMPSRAAESLFWLGRYAERAEGTVRLLRTVLDRRNDADAAGERCVRELLRALGDLTLPGAAPDPTDPEPGLLALIVDASRPGTLAQSVQGLVGAAESARDQLSGDTWLVLSSLERELDPLLQPSPDLHAAMQSTLAGVLRSLLALAGLGAESTERDPGWAFLDLGRRVERALALTALLRSTLDTVRDTATESLMLESVLVATESIITYRRRYRSQAQAETLLDLLVLDADNPRSLRFQLDRITADLAGLPAGPTAADEERRALDVSTRVRLADTADLAVADDGARTALVLFLDDLAARLSGLAEAVEQAHFAPGPAQHLFVAEPTEISGDSLGRVLP